MKPAYRVTCTNLRNGSTHIERVEADTELQARGKIDHTRYRVDSAVPIYTHKSAEYADGDGLNQAANAATLLAFVFIPCALPAIILAGMSLERSNGKTGRSALTGAVAAVVLWVVVVAVVLLQQAARKPIYG